LILIPALDPDPAHDLLRSIDFRKDQEYDQDQEQDRE